MIAVPAIWLFTALVLTLFGVVFLIGLVYFIIFAVFYIAVKFVIRPVLRAVSGKGHRYD